MKKKLTIPYCYLDGVFSELTMNIMEERIQKNIRPSFPERMNECDDDIEQMYFGAERRDEITYLRLAIEYVLASPGFDLATFGSYHGLDHEDVRRLLEYAYRKLWPERIRPASPPDIEIAAIGGEAWVQIRKEERPLYEQWAAEDPKQS